MEASSRHLWGYLLLCRALLVWMDWMDKVNPLDGPNRQRSRDWIRHLCYLPAMLQLFD